SRNSIRYDGRDSVDMAFHFYHPPEIHDLRLKRYAPMQISPGATESIRYVHLFLFVAPTMPVWLSHEPVRQRVRHLCGVRLMQTSDEHKDSHHVQQGKPRAVELGDVFANAAALAQPDDEHSVDLRRQ